MVKSIIANTIKTLIVLKVEMVECHFYKKKRSNITLVTTINTSLLSNAQLEHNIGLDGRIIVLYKGSPKPSCSLGYS